MSHPRIAELQVALMLLTRLPAGRIDQPPTTAAAAWAFPVVGALIGAVAGLACGAATLVGLSPLASALLAIAVVVALTGGLHEDGLADVADGFGGGQDTAQKLHIMRDSRIGSFGVVALGLVLGLIATSIAVTGTLGNFILIGALSRTAMLAPMAYLPPARPDGLGHAARLEPDKSLGAALAITGIIVLLTGSIAAFFIAALATLAMIALARHQIGGQTGDVLGATQKLSECAAWLTVAALA